MTEERGLIAKQAAQSTGVPGAAVEEGIPGPFALVGLRPIRKQPFDCV